MLILLIFAFVSGLVTIFAPCIWPLLPIILSSTTTGGHRKPLGITLGIMISFGLLTLSISYIVKIIPFDPNFLRYFAVFIITFLGLSLVIPKMTEILEVYVSRLSGKLNLGSKMNSSGFRSGFVMGLALGIIWTPCAGPILATIATLSATQAVNFNVILITFFYILGVGIPLFIFATIGKYIFSKTRVFSKYTGKAQQVFGVIMILTAILIATNYDKVLQAKLLDIFPSYSNFIVELETNDAVKKQLDTLKNGVQKTLSLNNNDLFNTNTPARDFTGITNWINTDKPLSIKELEGKVVLVDFWTYTCINCIRTLPYVTSWYEKYKDQGFVVIGVHTPEFEFEKDTGNVLNAIKQYKINYPVAQDNDYSTWNNYSNQYWPAKYLIDAKGNIRKVHFGEGEYEEMEMAIQTLLKEAGKDIKKDLSDLPDQTPKMRLSPETYLGADRMQYFFPTKNTGLTIKEFNITEDIPLNYFSLGGSWNITRESAISGTNSSLIHNFYANKVFLVLRPGKSVTSKVKVYLDGKIVDNKNQGSDVVNGEITIDSDKLYNLIDLKGAPGSHILKLEFENSDIEVYAFTFG